MLATDELLAKALTQTTQMQKLIPQLWAFSIETNLRKREVFQQSVLVNTDLTVPGAGDKVSIPSLPDLVAAVALVEGIDITPVALSNATSVPLTPSEVGVALDISRKAMDRMQYDAIEMIMDRLAYSMSLKLEGGYCCSGLCECSWNKRIWFCEWAATTGLCNSDCLRHLRCC